ncbi:hypothetical protein [Streptomyces bambusae]|uniref:Copper resistance protein D domain-containing protein n=1 Tax=Streptomyces bambusae TaxID=1550616 RepID=A0ABS6ZG92_9ACTN|nr:hypothetical protein [Streptomyces bambusae]MBW5486776.1 hypothetical protein [Streptomyces bambusae]
MPRSALLAAPSPSPLPASAPPAAGAVPAAAPTPLWMLAGLGVVASAFIGAACWMSGHLHADAALQTAARFVHVAALVVGLGSVLAVDWFALLWVSGRRPLADTLSTACALQVPIWGGLTGLVVSGLFLRPDLGSPLTLVKLGLVLAVMVNGLYAHRLGQLLERRRTPEVPHEVPRGLLVRSGIAAAVSQTGWWGATVIGFLNSQS